MEKVVDSALHQLISSGSFVHAVDSHAIVAVTDVRGDIIHANDLFCAISGYSREELIGQNHRLVNSGYHPKSFWVEMWSCVSSGRVWRSEVCNRRKDGELYWVDTTISPYLGGDGKIEGYISLRTDITPLKRKEVELLEAKRVLEDVGSMARVGGWEIDMDTMMPVWSSVTREIHEVNEDYEPDLETAIEFYKEGESRDAIQKAIERCIHDGSPWDVRLPLVTAKGNEIWVRAIGSGEFEDGNCIRLYGTFQDISKEMEAERALEDKNKTLEILSERFALATRASGIGTWDWDVVNNELTWDDQMFILYGTKRDDFSGAYEAWQSGLHPDDRDKAEEEVQKALEGLRELNTEFRVVWPDGTVRCLNAFSIVQRDDRGRPLRMIGTNCDITEQVKQREELFRLAHEANKASEAKSSFLANMSHEIRTPMNGVIGMASLLLDADDLPEEQKNYIEIINSSAQALLAIINDILDFSKIESGMMELESISFDAREVMSELESLLGLKAKEKGIDLVCSVATDVPSSLKGDPVRLRQIITNLADNAIKFTSEGGVIVTTQARSSSNENIKLRIQVQDTGIGIPKDKIRGLFDKFTQADSSTTRKFGGTGLGLAISKQLVELMGGQIGVDSELGSGSNFWFEVPFKVADLESAACSALDGTRASPAKIERASARIMLVEDNKVNQEVALALLQRIGLSAEVFNDGLEALEASKSNDFDLILMDVQMPRMNGLEASQRIRELEKAEGRKMVPIVAMTARARDEDRQECLASGMSDFISKPISKAKLSELLDVWLS